MDLPDFGTRLRWARRMADLTCSELDRAAQISHTAMLESGERTNPTSDTVKKLANVLGVPCGWLLADEGERPAEDDLWKAGVVAKAKLQRVGAEVAR